MTDGIADDTVRSTMYSSGAMASQRSKGFFRVSVHRAFVSLMVCTSLRVKLMTFREKNPGRDIGRTARILTCKKKNTKKASQ